MLEISLKVKNFRSFLINFVGLIGITKEPELKKWGQKSLLIQEKPRTKEIKGKEYEIKNLKEFKAFVGKKVKDAGNLKLMFEYKQVFY